MPTDYHLITPAGEKLPIGRELQLPGCDGSPEVNLTLGSELGRGKYGVVHNAVMRIRAPDGRETTTDGSTVIKLMWVKRTTASHANVHREADLLKAVYGDKRVWLQYVGTTIQDGRYYDQYALGMPKVPGISLDCYLDENQLSYVEKLKLLIAVLKKLRELHAKGIIHGDLNLTNILVSQDPSTGEYKVYIIDLGMACRVGELVKSLGPGRDCCFFTRDRINIPEGGEPAAKPYHDIYQLLLVFGIDKENFFHFLGEALPNLDSLITDFFAYLVSDRLPEYYYAISRRRTLRDWAAEARLADEVTIDGLIAAAEAEIAAIEELTTYCLAPENLFFFHQATTDQMLERLVAEFPGNILLQAVAGYTSKFDSLRNALRQVRLQCIERLLSYLQRIEDYCLSDDNFSRFASLSTEDMLAALRAAGELPENPLSENPWLAAVTNSDDQALQLDKLREIQEKCQHKRLDQLQDIKSYLLSGAINLFEFVALSMEEQLTRLRAVSELSGNVWLSPTISDDEKGVLSSTFGEAREEAIEQWKHEVWDHCLGYSATGGSRASSLAELSITELLARLRTALPANVWLQNSDSEAEVIAYLEEIKSQCEIEWFFSLLNPDLGKIFTLPDSEVMTAFRTKFPTNTLFHTDDDAELHARINECCTRCSTRIKNLIKFYFRKMEEADREPTDLLSDDETVRERAVEFLVTTLSDSYGYTSSEWFERARKKIRQLFTLLSRFCNALISVGDSAIDEDSFITLFFGYDTERLNDTLVSLLGEAWCKEKTGDAYFFFSMITDDLKEFIQAERLKRHPALQPYWESTLSLSTRTASSGVAAFVRELKPLELILSLLELEKVLSADPRLQELKGLLTRMKNEPTNPRNSDYFLRCMSLIYSLCQDEKCSLFTQVALQIAAGLPASIDIRKVFREAFSDACATAIAAKGREEFIGELIALVSAMPTKANFIPLFAAIHQPKHQAMRERLEMLQRWLRNDYGEDDIDECFDKNTICSLVTLLLVDYANYLKGTGGRSEEALNKFFDELGASAAAPDESAAAAAAHAPASLACR